MGPRVALGYLASQAWLVTSPRNSAISVRPITANLSHVSGGNAIIILRYVDATCSVIGRLDAFVSTASTPCSDRNAARTTAWTLSPTNATQNPNNAALG